MQKISYLFLIVLLVSVGACDGSKAQVSTDPSRDESETATGDLAAVKVIETKISDGASFNPAISFFVTANAGLGFTVSGADVDGDNTVGSPAITGVSVVAGDAIALVRGPKAATISACASRDIGTGSSDDQFDIAVSLDTTASMGAAAGTIASKISAFATSLAEAGVNAQFSGITVGDAYATKSGGASDFTDAISRGTLGTPPGFDLCERPDTGTSLISATDMSTFFNEVGVAVGSGCDGRAVQENYLGPIAFLNEQLGWRAGASRIIIGIGDQCAHTPTSEGTDGILPPFSPPLPSDLESNLSGVATVHWIGNSDEDLGNCASRSQYNMNNLSSATGGSFATIGSCGSSDTCNVDLTTLPILSTITAATVTECDFETEGDATVTVCFDVAIEGATANYCAVLELISTLGT